MLVFELLLVLTGISALFATVFWVRVAASHALRTASRLDGTERLAERSNRRALNGATIASAVTAGLVAATYFAGRSAGAF